MSITAQQFSQVFAGRIVATRSDSRSVNFVDVNNDGWEDIFISNGLEGGQSDLLYINDGTGAFTVANMDITQDNLASVGASFADADNDGHIDGFVTNWYGTTDGYFQNDEQGALILTEKNIRKKSFAEAAAWGDFDNDGWLDLYVTNSDGSRKNFLFRGLGGGDFEEIMDGAPVTDQHASRSVNWIDVNRDGHLDLFVGNEANLSNDLYLNDGNGGFVAKKMGVFVSTFSSSWGDIDNDGDFDLFVGNTNITGSKRNELLLNTDADFKQISSGTAHTDGGCTNGSAFGDFDNDGDLDLFVTNGFCSNNANFLYENQGDGTMIRADQELPGLRAVCSYGAAWGDIDNDGFLDLVVANCKNDGADSEQTNDLYQNNGNDNHWLKIKLVGSTTNRSAIGSVVGAKSMIDGKEVWQWRQVSSQSGYSGQNSLWVHFGMKSAEVLDSLIIDWPAGGRDVLKNIPVDQHLTITEGTITSNKNDKRFFYPLRAWPNPLKKESDQIFISLARPYEFGKKVAVQLIDTLGRLIWQEKIRGRDQLDVEEWSFSLQGVQLTPGPYILRVEGKTSVAVEEIVVY